MRWTREEAASTRSVVVLLGAGHQECLRTSMLRWPFAVGKYRNKRRVIKVLRRQGRRHHWETGRLREGERKAEQTKPISRA